MEKIKSNLPIFSFIVIPFTLVCLRIWGIVGENSREDLSCKGQPDCVDLRGLENLYLAFLVATIAGALAITIAYYGFKKSQKFAIPALFINGFLTLVLLIITVVAFFRR